MAKDQQSGQLLLEALIAISLLAIIVTIGGQIIFASLQSNKVTGERDIALGLVEETYEATRGTVVEKWQNVYLLSKGGSSYYPQKSSGKWILTSGVENVVINGVTYNRSFTIQNVCRDGSTGNITGITDNGGADTACVASGGVNDPSTQRITANVSWAGADPISSNQYVTRWLNKVCAQTSWASVGSGPSSCPSSVYESKSNITPGASLQLCPGGC